MENVKENPYKKVGNQWFHKEIKDMSYDDFVKNYKDVLRGCEIDEAAKILGVKMPNKKEKPEKG